jgi:putative transposase
LYTIIVNAESENQGIMPASAETDERKRIKILEMGLTHLTGGRVGATRTYACGEGTGGVSCKREISHPSLKQESPCGFSGWGW